TEKIIENIVRISSFNPLYEFQKFLLSNNNRINFLCDYSEQIVDIFSLPNDVAIDHCISQCLTTLPYNCIENNTTSLALPKICTRQDKKDWKVISTMIKFIFQDSQIKVLICLLPGNYDEKQNKYLQNNDPQTNNFTLGKNFNNIINNKLKAEIEQIAGSFIKSENVLADGDVCEVGPPTLFYQLEK
ncbi:Uncharacterized protein FWK35_00027973, partial [Aphis craccivora]